MPWIKLYTDILDDRILGRLPISAKWRFIELLLLAGQCDADGYLVDGVYPYTESDLAWRFRISEEQLQADLEHLFDAGLILFDDDAWLVPNFSKRQGRSQDEKRLRWREQKRRQRAVKLAHPYPLDTCQEGQPTEIKTDSVLNVRADIVKDVHPVRLLEEEGEEDIEKEEDIEENHHHLSDEIPKKSYSNPSAPMMRKNSSPTDYFCDSFGIESITPEQYNTLKDLEIHYGPKLLCKVIDWAVSRQIHPNRAVYPIKTAIAGWQDKPKKPIHAQDPNTIDPNINYYEVYKEALESGRLDKYLDRK